MLVLTRKPGERVVVPNCDLTITVLTIEGNRVRLGISAPPALAVYREEVWLRIRREGQETQAEKLVQERNT
jgi:carbon storage regulator